MADENRQDALERVRGMVRGFPSGPGLYFFKGEGDTVLYIGKAKNLRSRAGSYFQASADLEATRGPKIVEMIKKVVSVDFLETENEVDAMLQEARLIKDIRPPYNTDLTDGKTFPYVEVTTGEEYPGVYVTRTPRASGSKLFGPFTAGRDLRNVVVMLQKAYKFRTCKLDIREADAERRFFRPCILYSIKQCTAPCAAKVEKKEYRKQVNDFIRFLRSNRSAVLKDLRKKMGAAAAERAYEEAAVYRDRIRLIEALDLRGTPERNLQPELFAADPAEALIKLQKLFETEDAIRIIEGIDIAHLSGEEMVGSLVKFIDGRPFKSGYRRFKIGTVEGIDDCASIKEVVKRRYKYAMRGEELWPDLILIDGGLGQLHAAEEGLAELGAPAVRVASLAKKQEEIFLPGRGEAVRLARTNAGLKLLQYVRDEAHRFAQHYHHVLRRKKTVGE